MNSAFLCFRGAKQWMAIRASGLSVIYLTVVALVMLMSSANEGSSSSSCSSTIIITHAP